MNGLSPALLFLLQALLLIAGPFLLWRIGGGRHVAPMVVIQIMFGVALGPSLFGRLMPELWGVLFAPAALAPLSGLSLLAVVFFAFLTGLHLDPAEFRGRGAAFATVSLSSMLVPTLLGGALGWWLAGAFPAMSGPHATPGLFAAGFGICVGVTALPVLGAILREMDLLGDRVGRLALGYAAVNDALLWLLITAALAWSSSGGSGNWAVARIALLGFAYLAATVLVARPLLDRLLDRLAPDGRMGEMAVVVICTALLASAAVTELIGLHYILGAFIAGTAMPRRFAAAILDRLEHFSTLILLPFFFTLTGLKVTLMLDDPAQWTVFALASLATLAGKMAGTTLPARLTGESWRDALRLGTLMPCKGLMEVIVLTVLLEAGVLSGPCFSAMVLMAVAVTALTQPMTLLVDRLRPVAGPAAAVGGGGRRQL
ncbi:cation:proton antiporter domain-containing protein [Azospirillum picis]|uniref:Kef-type K+ transport system membrane component KefB n=1 Tax=Azospirillum picis TaxID=488438 RepID=A0ABU0MRS1_9PROT|nr:cation:proton antiporter [Azospirillum picis]MBP2302340.1 Kef-type K+ transport system membrane component KefB [Azospirillum picis]MDQ0535919.1 Kef-type K+ transport system membrane component KefB [Azospirillum picis]